MKRVALYLQDAHDLRIERRAIVWGKFLEHDFRHVRLLEAQTQDRRSAANRIDRPTVYIQYTFWRRGGQGRAGRPKRRPATQEIGSAAWNW